MEIFDCFCGAGAWGYRDPIQPYEPEELLKLMDYFGIGKALVYGMLVDKGRGWPVDVNRQALEAAALSNRFIPAFVLGRHAHEGSPTTDDYFKEIRRTGAGGVFLKAASGSPLKLFAGWLVDELLERCAAHKLPVFFHVEDESLDTVYRICRSFPHLPLVLTGAGYNSDDCLFPLLERHKNLYISIGHYYIPAGGPMRFLKRFSAERLLFGSGMPLFSPGGLIGHIQYAPIPESDKALIFGGNMERLLGERAL